MYFFLNIKRFQKFGELEILTLPFNNKLIIHIIVLHNVTDIYSCFSQFVFIISPKDFK